ncbi:MAG: hypothetical protein F6K26_36180, partial [Moorea sp. SIO2I5]|nr:hypothetical protein [Moorena sp. SIO2I5]
MKTLDELLSDLRRLDVKLWVDGDKLRYSAPKGILKPPLRTQLKERKAEIVKFLNETNLALSSTPEQIIAIPRDKNLPLSFSQEGFWFIDKMEGISATYNLFSSLKFIGLLNVVALNDSNSGTEVLTLKSGLQIESLTFSPDGSRIITTTGSPLLDESGTVQVWDTLTGEVAFTLRGHSGPVRSVAVSPDGA